MIINAVGCPHSGTDILRSLLAGAGVRTRLGGLVLDRRLVDRRIPYDCYNFPEWVTKWIDESEMSGENDYMHREKEFFHDTWERFSIMYALEQRYPKLRFLIILRDPREVIGDWFNIQGTTGPEVTIDTYRDTVLRIYHFMWEQVDLMKNKPIIMDYDLSHYLQLIFEMFKIENSLENIHKAQGFLKGSYTKTEMYEGDISEILFYQNKIKAIK